MSDRDTLTATQWISPTKTESMAGAVWTPEGDPTKATSIFYSGPCTLDEFADAFTAKLKELGYDKIIRGVNSLWWECPNTENRKSVEWIEIKQKRGSLEKEKTRANES